MANDQLFIDVLAQIEREPKRWEQSDWGTQTKCGTAFCFAGHAIAITEGEAVFAWNDDGGAGVELADGRDIEDTAAAHLDLTYSECDLFEPNHSLGTLYEQSAAILGLDVTVLRDKVQDALTSHVLDDQKEA